MKFQLMLSPTADERPEVLTVDVIAAAPAEVLSTTTSEFPSELKDDFVEGEEGVEKEEVEAEQKVDTPTEKKIPTPTPTPTEETGDVVDDKDDVKEDSPTAAPEDTHDHGLDVSEPEKKKTVVETSDVEPLSKSDVGSDNVADQEDKPESLSEKKVENEDEIKTGNDDEEPTQSQPEVITTELEAEPENDLPELKPLDPVPISTPEEVPITTVEDDLKSNLKLDNKSAEEVNPTTIDSPVSKDTSSSRTVATTTSTHTTPSETNNDKVENDDESIEDKVNNGHDKSSNNSRQGSPSSALNAITNTNNNNSVLHTPTSQSRSRTQSQSHPRSLPQPQQIFHSRSGSLAESLGTLVVSPGGGASGAGPALSLGLSASKSLPSVDLNSDSVVASDHLVRKSTSVASSLRLGDAIKFSSSSGAGSGAGADA
ncbi:unnamed protein product [Ambrosiozyma monospora]|uniref:Unnamed protein product n=1 Tax=Ambrosiozyma monospora TaxID=43982 RepID=A0ACB5T4W3_AMBMO|nr:unnamed protein product [Ambrosiozyma monospora]